MKRIALTIAFVFAASAIYVSCKKDDVADTETTSATDNSLCEGEFLRVLPTVNKIAIDEPGVHRIPSSATVTSTCPSVSLLTAPNQFPVTMQIDYGTGCTDSVDGKVRSGRINVTYDRSWDSSGCVMTMVLDSFYVGAIHFEGTCTVTRTANQFHQVINNGRCSKAGSAPWEILWNTDKTITWTTGNSNSQGPQIIEVTGTNSGTDRNGKTFTATVTSPITRDLTCSWITKGTVVLTPEGKPERTIDYGDGNCDNRGTITIEGNTFEFTMN